MLGTFGPLDATAACQIDTDQKTITCQFALNILYTALSVAEPDGGPEATVFVLSSLKIEPNVTVSVSGSAPLILYVLGPVEIDGILASNAIGPAGGAGSVTSGPGPGTSDNHANGAGGGGFCGAGGAGSPGAGDAGVGGAGGGTYGEPNLIPLLGGAQGGSAADTGYGGGAVQITSTTSITVGAAGAVACNGSGGDFDTMNAGGGGGSGGAILLEAPTVTVAGTLAANGGGGGDGTSAGSSPGLNATPAAGAGMVGGAGGAGSTINGQNGVTGAAGYGGGGGGAGWIRINTASGSASMTGTLSPSAPTACVTVSKVMPP